MSILAWTIIAFGVVLFITRSKRASKFAAVLILVGTIYLIYTLFTYQEPRDRFIEENQISIYDYTIADGNLRAFPWYGEDQENYYIIKPAIFYSYPKDNNCPGFAEKNLESWCAESLLHIMSCYNEDPETCFE